MESWDITTEHYVLCFKILAIFDILFFFFSIFDFLNKAHLSSIVSL